MVTDVPLNCLIENNFGFLFKVLLRKMIIFFLEYMIKFIEMSTNEYLLMFFLFCILRHKGLEPYITICNLNAVHRTTFLHVVFIFGYSLSWSGFGLLKSLYNCSVIYICRCDNKRMRITKTTDNEAHLLSQNNKCTNTA